MTATPLPSLLETMLAEIDPGLRACVDRLPGSRDGLWSMVSYSMGWGGSNSGPQTAGKRIRPLMCLLVAGGAGGNWRAALPAALAVELIHSFSLVHDDIQDESLLRRSRPSVWSKYGVAHAINVGDSLFSLAFDSVAAAGAERAAPMLETLAATCLRLTHGQFLDMTYARAESITTAEYFTMIDEKTAALLECACRLGAISAGAEPARRAAFASFGGTFGLAFQIYDDYLGIWGEPAAIGKSAESDILSRKKSLPILYGLEHSPKFRGLFAEVPSSQSVPEMAAELEHCGAREYTLAQVREKTDAAFAALSDSRAEGEYGEQLRKMAEELFGLR